MPRRTHCVCAVCIMLSCILLAVGECPCGLCLGWATRFQFKSLFL